MPIRKLRSVEDGEDAGFRDRDDPNLLRTIRAVWKLSARLCPRSFPPGVHRYRSIEDANRGRDAWEADAARELNPEGKQTVVR